MFLVLGTGRHLVLEGRHITNLDGSIFQARSHTLLDPQEAA